MVSALEAARKAARKAIEKTYYTGLCSVVERRDVRDEQTKITHKSEVTVIENQPCKLSFEKLDATDRNGGKSYARHKAISTPGCGNQGRIKDHCGARRSKKRLFRKRRSCCISHPSRNYPHTV